MQQLIVMAMQTCSEYAQKSAAMTLTEYEMLMYEQLCRAVQAYMQKLESELHSQKGNDGEITNNAA